MADHAPDDVDWVGAQANCNAETMFARLRTRVRDDVNKRNALFSRNDGWKFEFYEEGDHFEVSRLVGGGLKGPNVAAVVAFERAGRHIHVQGEDIDIDFTAIVTIDVSGACRFVVGEAMYSDWEISRMALDVLFFEEVEEPE